MNPRLKALVDFAERTGLGGGRMSYAEYEWRGRLEGVMETFRFRFEPNTRGGYVCNKPGYQDGEYVKADVAAELLAACKAALSLLQNIGTGKWAKTPAGDALRAAIAKATGAVEARRVAGAGDDVEVRYDD